MEIMQIIGENCDFNHREALIRIKAKIEVRIPQWPSPTLPQILYDLRGETELIKQDPVACQYPYC